MSGDGTFAVGSKYRSNSDAMRWTNKGVPLVISSTGRATGVSFDGSVVIGNDGDPEAFRWTNATGIQRLGVLPGHQGSSAWDISADGSIVVGLSGGASGGEAFLWTSGFGMIGLGTLPGHDIATARGVSADGSVVVGESYLDGVFIREAFLWTEVNGMQGLGALSGSAEGSIAWDVSADGLTIVGTSDSAAGFQAFRWTQAGGMVGLGDLPGGSFHSQAQAVSADGSVIVGFSNSNFDPPIQTGQGFGLNVDHEAFIWDETNGMRPLKNVLSDAGVDLTGWYLLTATGISDDGKVIGGRGINPLGQEEAWLARLNTVPEPSSIFLLLTGYSLTSIRCFRRRCRWKYQNGHETCID